MAHRIALVDSYRLLVEALGAAIEQDLELEIIPGACGEEQYQRVCQADLDLILLGSNLSNFGDLGTHAELVERLKKNSPSSKLMILVRPENPLQPLAQALQAGADGAITTEASLKELSEAIHTILAGRGYLPPEVSLQLIQQPTESYSQQLSIREVGILSGLAYGHTNQEIADRLHLSVRTVEANRSALNEKLNLESRAEMVSYALEHGMMGESSQWSEMGRVEQPV